MVLDTATATKTRGQETKIAERLIAEEGVYLPSILRFPSAARVSVAFDNVDINEGTSTGSHNTHVTNGIAVQRQVAWCHYQLIFLH